uniref:EF-hand domain-containing protein n=2 Tax=Panagrolaimus sp. JU765 TaxID=591449 RepID=A0AC34QM51_9BILA
MAPKKSSEKPSEENLVRPSAATIEHCENSEECETWWDFFKFFDKDNDGKIPVKEMRRAVAKNKHFFKIDKDQVKEIVDNCDRNNDKMIDFPEFCELMLTAKHQRLKRMAVYMGNAVLPKSRQAEATNYLVEYTCWPPPLFIINISIIEIAFYLYYALGDPENPGIRSDGPPPLCSLFALQPNSKWELWRYFGYVFLHNGYVHVISNVFMQLLLGLSLELVHKGFRIMAIYFIGAFVGGMLFFVFDPDTYLVGASGGVYSLISAHLADVIMNWSEMPFRWIRIIFFSFWISADFGYAIYSRYIAGEMTKVAVTGHIGGALAGLFLGVVVLRNLEKKKWEKLVQIISLVIFVGFAFVCVILVLSGVHMKSVQTT